MKISFNWIKDFVEIDPDISSRELAETITLSVCEVEGIEETGRHLKDVLVAEVLEINPHPDAEKLSLVTVNLGASIQQVVCGASNYKIGDKVPYAGEGVTLPGDFLIKKAKIRGIESCGMLCAEDELGFSDDHLGLMILPQNTEVGTPLVELYPDQVDLVMEIDNKSITHRPDLWGHYGFAREIGAIFRVPVKEIAFDATLVSGNGDRLIDVDVLGGELVPRFSGLSIDNIQIGPSPVWIQHRLLRVGLRPINNMVDLTNYVMLELGQPMHAFDAEQIDGSKLIVKLADKGTKVTTLYQKEVELGPYDMIICDVNEALSVAGVIGGLNSGITLTTSRIFLEAANWDPVCIRKTSTRIGLRTDACQRYEKSLDPELTVLAIQRAVELLKLTSPDLKICGDLVDIRNKNIPSIIIQTNTEFICRRLGKNIDHKEIVDILTHLDFNIAEDGNDLAVEVPSFRRTKDISIPEDLVEEIGRIHGFNNITPQAPVFPIERPVFNRQHKFEQLAKFTLSKSQYHEVVNYPLTCQKTEDVFGLDPEGIMVLKNPVADHQNQMRTSLLPHFVQSIFENQKITYDFKLFEIGRMYRKKTSGDINESIGLIAGVSKKLNQPGDAFYCLKSDLIKLFSGLQLGNINWKPIEPAQKKEYQHINISAEVFSDQTKLGTVYCLTPEYVDKVGLKEDVCFAELDFDLMFSLDKTEFRYQAPPKFPSVFFEVSLIIPERVVFQEIHDIIVSTDSLVSNVKFLDIYRLKEQIGKKSISVSIEFRSSKKTLNTEEVKQLQDNVVASLAQNGYNLRKI